ncbi:hypothetical protein D3C72_2046400 [compost metagenome]
MTHKFVNAPWIHNTPPRQLSMYLCQRNFHNNPLSGPSNPKGRPVSYVLEMASAKDRSWPGRQGGQLVASRLLLTFSDSQQVAVGRPNRLNEKVAPVLT